MMQILKRTKKSCGKLFRKMGIHSSINSEPDETIQQNNLNNFKQSNKNRRLTHNNIVSGSGADRSYLPSSNNNPNQIVHNRIFVDDNDKSIHLTDDSNKYCSNSISYTHNNKSSSSFIENRLRKKCNNNNSRLATSGGMYECHLQNCDNEFIYNKNTKNFYQPQHSNVMSDTISNKNNLHTKNNTTNSIEQINLILNKATQHIRNTISHPKIPFQRYKFTILKEDELLFNNASSSVAISDNFELLKCAEIIFEKVNYDENKRYLRHSPSNSTSNSLTGTPQLLDRKNSLSHDTWKCSSYGGGGGRRDDDKFSNNFAVVNHRKSCNLQNGWDLHHHHHHHHHHQAFDYEEHQHKFGDDRKMSRLKNRDLHIMDSLKSSSTTLETWIDDESFDNSFNEEMEITYNFQNKHSSFGVSF